MRLSGSKLPTPTFNPFLPLPFVLLGLAGGEDRDTAHPAQRSVSRAGPREAGASPRSARTPSAPRAPGRTRRPAAGARTPRLSPPPGARPAPSSRDTPSAQHPRTSAPSNPARVTFPLHPPPPGAAPGARRGWARAPVSSPAPSPLRLTARRPLRASPRHGGSQQVHPS